jgi:hypothetical protein
MEADVLPLPEEFEPDEAILRYLIELPDVFLSHSGTTLFHHLLGTYRILKSWRCKEDLCLAGLFHSIYGTPVYRPGPLPESRRVELRAIVGARAEELAHEFSRVDWSDLLARGDRALRTQSADLITLAAANFVEQVGRIAQLSGDDLMARESLGRFDALLPRLTPSAAAHLGRELARLRHEL